MIQNKTKKSKKGLITSLVVLGIAIIIVGLVVISTTASQAAKSEAYKSQFTEIQGASTTFQGIYDQYFNTPSSTTRTNSDWDTYYTGIKTQIQTLTTTVSGFSYTDSRLNQAQQLLQKGLSDFASLITLAQSNIDMQFQVTNDKSKINSDKTIMAEESDFPGGYITANQTQLNTDNATLAADQKTYDEQSQELTTLAGSLGTDDSNLKAAIAAAQSNS